MPVRILNAGGDPVVKKAGVFALKDVRNRANLRKFAARMVDCTIANAIYYDANANKIAESN